jgi:hypothetical protein
LDAVAGRPPPWQPEAGPGATDPLALAKASGAGDRAVTGGARSRPQSLPTVVAVVVVTIVIVVGFVAAAVH